MQRKLLFFLPGQEVNGSQAHILKEESIWIKGNLGRIRDAETRGQVPTQVLQEKETSVSKQQKSSVTFWL